MKRLYFWFILFLSLNTYAEEFYGIIRLTQPRMNGSGILHLQEKLLSLGFSEIGIPDGWFGPKTEAVFKEYQEYWGFAPNGIVTKDIWEILFSENLMVLRIHQDIKVAHSIKPEDCILEEQNLLGVTTEGGSIERYSKDNEIKFIKASLLGEMGQGHYKIYKIGNRSIVLSVEYQYPRNYDIDNAKIEYSMYYYTEDAKYIFRNGQIISGVYDSFDILNFVNEELFNKGHR